MSDPLDQVRAANPVPSPQPLAEEVCARLVAAVTAGGARRRAPRRGRLLALAAALAVAGGTTAGALAVIGGQPSAPPSGRTQSATTIPHSIGTASDAYSVFVSPGLGGGSVGWCLAVTGVQTTPLTRGDARVLLARSGAVLARLRRALLTGVLDGRSESPTLVRRQLASLTRLLPALREYAAGRDTPALRARLTGLSGGGGASSSLGCDLVQRPGAAIIGSNDGWSTTRDGDIVVDSTSYVYLTTSEVAAVRVAPDLTILTRPDAKLPDHYRIAIDVRTVTSRPGPYRGPSPAPVALGADGRPIPAPPPRPAPHDAAIYWQRSASHRAGAPAGPPAGACEISLAGLPGAQRWFGEVVQHVRGFPALAAPTFLSCANTSFYVDGQSVVAAILLDAQHPGARPEALPASTAVPGQPAARNEPQPAVTRLTLSITGRRVGAAWLVVQSDGTLAQRLAILDRLRACVRLAGPPCAAP